MHFTLPSLRRALAAIALAAVTAVPAGSIASAQSSAPGGVTVVADPDPSRIECPIPSGSEFIDSFGAARSGGRRHKGVDMIADRGTPIVAAQSGWATFKRSRLGGNAVWLTTETGNKFYYAHLDGFEGESRDVEAGEVIGYVGSTGNANGPHLHFETYFDGSVDNPYDETSSACEPAPLPAVIETAAAQAELRRSVPTDAGAVVPYHRLL